MLADDLTLILLDLKSIDNALKILNDFSRCTGLCIYKLKPNTSESH